MTRLQRVQQALTDANIQFVDGSNFDLRIQKEDAERLIRGLRDGEPIIPDVYVSVMCAEYGGDDDWCGMCAEDLNEDDCFDEDYQTFEIWV